jgi:hypothetical protein
MKRVQLWGGISVGFVLLMLTAAPFALAAYSSHQNDQDISSFLSVYPFAKSTKLDDCSLCHPGGSITSGGKTSTYGSCDYCHLTYKLAPPHGPVPLNNYGSAYNTAGRTAEALRSIETADSDGDGFTNGAEVQALFYPGSATDYPGLVSASAIIFNQWQIVSNFGYCQFMLANASKSTDYYAKYCGLKMADILKLAGVSSTATQITVFSPDGFSKTFPMKASSPPNPANIQYDVLGSYPYGYYYGDLDFVDYTFNPGYPYDGFRISEMPYMLLAYNRDGSPLTTGKLIPDPANPGRLVLDGEGPYRLVNPQKIAGSPDRPSTAAPEGDGWDYSASKDHNWGSSVRSVAAIRVDPLPAGTTDFKWTEGGWNLVDNARLVIYGAISPNLQSVVGTVRNAQGTPIPNAKISFGFVSLGAAGEITSDAAGSFRALLPAGDYIAIPSKPGFTFVPESMPINLYRKTGYTIDFVAYPAP